jgi:hypothetical protein
MAAAAASKAAKRERQKHAAAKVTATTDPAAPSPTKPVGGVANPHDLGVTLGNIAQEALGRLFRPK